MQRAERVRESFVQYQTGSEPPDRFGRTVAADPKPASAFACRKRAGGACESFASGEPAAREGPYEAGRGVDKVYFPEGGAVSLVVALATGEIIETALIGHDGAVGGQEALQNAVALSRAVVQIEGPALAIEADSLRRISATGSELRKRLDCYDRYIFAQAQQSAACNVAHSLDARLARWLLRAYDLCGSHFTLTQEAVAAFLGVRRTSVSLTAHGFQDAGLIHYRRGEIDIVDADALRAIACECYATLATHRERLLAQPPPRATLGLIG